LTDEEFENLRFQFGTSSLNYGGRRYLPYAFTEQGIAMASAILRSHIAIKVSVEIMEAFVEMRRMLISNASLFHRLDKIELKQLQADQKFEKIFKALENDKLHSEKGIFTTDRFLMPMLLFLILSVVLEIPLSCLIIMWMIRC
jgi:hypothetical protein